MGMKRKEKIQKLLQKKPKFTVVESPQQPNVKPALTPISSGKEESFGNATETLTSQPLRSQPFRKSLPHKPFDRTSRFPKDGKKRTYYEGKALEDKIERVKAAMSRKGESAEYIENVVNKIRRTAEMPAKRKGQGLLLQGKALEDKIERVKAAMSRKGESAEYIENVVNKIRRTAEIQEKKMPKRCYCCRSTDHTMKDCKRNPGLATGLTSWCFSCGSGEHSYKDCPSKLDHMNRGLCFICKKHGHLAKDCYANKRRALPLGREFKKCGAKDHLAEGCTIPDEKEYDDEVTLPAINDVTMSADAEILGEEENKIPDDKEDDDEGTLPTINDVTMNADAEILGEQENKLIKTEVCRVLDSDL